MEYDDATKIQANEPMIDYGNDSECFSFRSCRVSDSREPHLYDRLRGISFPEFLFLFDISSDITNEYLSFHGT